MEVVDMEAFGRVRTPEESALLTTSAPLTESTLPTASVPAEVRPPFHLAAFGRVRVSEAEEDLPC
jgi:hypothetical protein